MSVWLTIPSARTAAEADPTLAKWRERGYLVALWRDLGSEPIDCDILVIGEYPGYARAVNYLCKEVLERDLAAAWCVAGGDDTLPDPNHAADEIAQQCAEHFGGTFGVMQPTGDRYAGGCIDRIAGSPWLGREWCQRANAGQGPFWPEFVHMFGDECLMRTAVKLGVYWQRPELVHFHEHFMRKSSAIDSPAAAKNVPPHLIRWNSPQHWREMETIFRNLEAQDFEPCMPLGGGIYGAGLRGGACG